MTETARITIPGDQLHGSELTVEERQLLRDIRDGRPTALQGRPLMRAIQGLERLDYAWSSVNLETGDCTLILKPYAADILNAVKRKGQRSE